MRLICMSFDGEFKTNSPVFEDAEDAWRYSNDLGSTWYFYPFHMVVTNSAKTVIETGPGLEFLQGRRVKSVAAFFGKVCNSPEADGRNIEEFVRLLQES